MFEWLNHKWEVIEDLIRLRDIKKTHSQKIADRI